MTSSDDSSSAEARRAGQVTIRLSAGTKRWYGEEGPLRGLTPHALMVRALEKFAEDNTPDRPIDPSERQMRAQLAELVHHYGEAYAITMHGKGMRRRWIAQRRDGENTLTAGSAEGLLVQIRADYSRHAVPRDVPHFPPSLLAPRDDERKHG